LNPSLSNYAIFRSDSKLEDLVELRAAVECNAGKAGTPWESVKAELDLD
jgi:hypothetical protein